MNAAGETSAKAAVSDTGATAAAGEAAIVTGAAGALGRAITRRLAASHQRLLLVDVAADGLRATAQELGSEVDAEIATLTLDLAAPDCGEKLVAALNERGWTPHTLVNNAGINRDARATKMSEQQFREVLRVDLLAPWRLAEALAPLMSSGGRIVNISSRAALGQFGQANYSAAKSGLVTLTRALALRWAPQITVNAVAPGLVDTPMTAGMPEKVLTKLIDRIPAGRMADPAEIAGLVAFLAAGDGCAYITGQTLFACGGRSFAP